MKRKLTAMLLVIVLVFVAAGCATTDTDNLSSGEWSVPDQVNIATLGEEYVPAILYAYFFALYHQHLLHTAMMGGHNMETFWGIEQDGVPLRQWLMDETIRAAIEYSGFYRLGLAQGMTEAEEDGQSSEAQVANLLEQMENNRETFIRTYRITPEQMREAMRMVNVAMNYLTTSMDAVVIPDEAIREAYELDPDSFAEVTVRHVLIDVREITDDDERAQATALAESILERINAGEPIGQLAAQYSDDPGSRDTDGEYTFGKGVMVPEFEQWAFAAQPGDTGIVLTSFGYHVMQMMSRSADTSEIENQLRVEIFEENHRELHDLVYSDEWVFDEDLIVRFATFI